MTLTDLVNRVVAYVPEAPLLTAREAVRWAMHELCDEGNIWRERRELTVTDDDPPFITLEDTAEAEPVRVLSIKEGDRFVSPGDYTQTTPSRIEFAQMRDTSLTVRLALRPAPEGDIPADLMSQWRETLEHGARHHLLMVPQPWQNPELASYYERKFKAGQAHARQIASHGYQTGGARVRARRFI